MRAAITGAGHYVPSKVVTNHDLSKLMPTDDEWIVQRTGIKERRFVEHDGIGASDLALPASKMALEQAGLAPAEVDAIIFATLSPDVNSSPDDAHGILDVELHADGSGARDLWLEAPASMHAPRLTAQMMEEGRHYPRMNGKAVFRWAVEKMPEVASATLARLGMSWQDVDLFVPHQANMRINQLVAMKLNIPQEKVVHNIDRYGNTTAATIPIGLSESWKSGRITKGTRVLMAAFGAGFTWASSVVRF